MTTMANYMKKIALHHANGKVYLRNPNTAACVLSGNADQIEHWSEKKTAALMKRFEKWADSDSKEIFKTGLKCVPLLTNEGFFSSDKEMEFRDTPDYVELLLTRVGEHFFDGGLYKDCYGRYYVDCNTDIEDGKRGTVYRLCPSDDPEGEPDRHFTGTIKLF